MPAVLRFSVTGALRVSNDVVWQVLGDFGTEHRMGFVHVDGKKVGYG
jgi:hypothetical protein